MDIEPTHGELAIDTPVQIERYMSRISGPLLDRIDIHIEVPRMPFEDLSGGMPGTSSQQMREMVLKLEKNKRPDLQGPAPGPTRRCRVVRCVSIVLWEDPKNSCCAIPSLRWVIGSGADKIIRVARTIADVDDSEEINVANLTEAINYRMLDRDIWS